MIVVKRNDFVRQSHALVHALNNSSSSQRDDDFNNGSRTLGGDDDDDDGKDSNSNNDGFDDDHNNNEEDEEDAVNKEHEKERETVAVVGAEDHGDGTCGKEIDTVVSQAVTSSSASLITPTTTPADGLSAHNNRLAFQLKNWQIRHTNDASSVGRCHNGSAASLLSVLLPSEEEEAPYLVHPPVLLVVDVATKTPPTSHGGDSAGGDSGNQTKHIDDLHDDRGVDGRADEDDIVHFLEVGDDNVATLLEEDESNQIQGRHRLTPGTTDAATSRSTLWHFSIVYSDTYRVPVLYFHVQYEQMMIDNESSSILGRREVLDMLLNIQREQQQQEPSQQGDQPDDQDDITWEFISQEEHPITGFPSFFLHPCQSSDRMNLVLSSLLLTSSSSLSSCNSNDSDDNNLSDSLYLWTWMSMIFPAVGHPIPSTYFVKIQNRLLLQERRRTHQIFEEEEKERKGL